ncbi:MAG: hypothetical protein WAK67_13535, partial [Xanthobacteraceae bacterium]
RDLYEAAGASLGHGLKTSVLTDVPAGSQRGPALHAIGGVVVTVLGRSAVQKIKPHPSSAFSLLLLTLALKICRFMHPLTEAETALSV